jgi:predicted kinase
MGRAWVMNADASVELAPLIGAIRISSDTERKRDRPLQPAEERPIGCR